MAKDSKNKMPKDAKKNSKDKRHFWKDFRAELKKVNWLTPKQLINNTVAVVSIVIIVAVIVLVLDLGFEALNKYGINKLRETVENSTSQNETNNITENSNEETNSANDKNTTEEGTNAEENQAGENTAQQ